MPDARSEALAIWKQYFGNPTGLAARLSQICLNKPGVVYQVFLILNAYSTLDVG